jgi:hypothetical protein
MFDVARFALLQAGVRQLDTLDAGAALAVYVSEHLQRHLTTAEVNGHVLVIEGPWLMLPRDMVVWDTPGLVAAEGKKKTRQDKKKEFSKQPK